MLIRDAVCVDDYLPPTIYSSSNLALFLTSNDDSGIISINNVRYSGKVNQKVNEHILMSLPINYICGNSVVLVLSRTWYGAGLGQTLSRTWYGAGLGQT